MEDTIKWMSPFVDPDLRWSVPVGRQADGGFGSKMKLGLSTGVRLGCQQGALISPVEPGVITRVITRGRRPPRGRRAKARGDKYRNLVMIEGRSGTVVYGNVQTVLQPGEWVTPEDTILGEVTSPCLWIELYAPGVTEQCWWGFRRPKPEKLFDPTTNLLGLLITTRTSTRDEP
jgi:hypothetical protein